MITGTPQYMAPEQATGTKVGPQADVYALGIVAYEMFTGRVPFSADTPVAVLMKHMQEPLPLPSPQTVPEPLLRPLLKCTAKKPEERWPSAGAFVGALEAGSELPLPPTGACRRWRSPARRRRRRVRASAVPTAADGAAPAVTTGRRPWPRSGAPGRPRPAP
jgi:serine/threonine-protein kinase